MQSLTQRERDMMEHALGRDYPHKKKDFRNYYAIGEESEDIAVWRGLVERGLASERPKVPWTGLVYFHVTDAGKAAL